MPAFLHKTCCQTRLKGLVWQHVFKECHYSVNTYFMLDIPSLSCSYASFVFFNMYDIVLLVRSGVSVRVAPGGRHGRQWRHAALAVYAIRDVCETAWAITVHHPPPSRHPRPDHLPPPGTSPNTTWPRPVLLDHPGARPNLASTVSHRGVFVWHPTDMADMVRWRGM